MARGGSKSLAGSSKRSQTTASAVKRDESTQDSIPLKLQQQCLDIFRSALKPGQEDQTVLQEVKGHLFDRDFASAFGKEEYLRVYASRWSPSRALAYCHVLHDVDRHLELNKTDGLHAVCIGGGAGGELVALAACNSLDSSIEDVGARRKLDVTLVDIAEWAHICGALSYGIQSPPELSKYASQAKRDANKALLEGDALSVTFQRQDVLNLDQDQETSFYDKVRRAHLVTFMFTLNELYTTSLANTQKLLAILTKSMAPGTSLLIVDSPGSYSTVSINGAEKRYPMQWLLDHTLLTGPTKDNETQVASWEKVLSVDSRWFRLSDSLQYPIDLEDMRYQIHLYRRLGDGDG